MWLPPAHISFKLPCVSHCSYQHLQEWDTTLVLSANSRIAIMALFFSPYIFCLTWTSISLTLFILLLWWQKNQSPLLASRGSNRGSNTLDVFCESNMEESRSSSQIASIASGFPAHSGVVVLKALYCKNKRGGPWSTFPKGYPSALFINVELANGGIDCEHSFVFCSPGIWTITRYLGQ